MTKYMMVNGPVVRGWECDRGDNGVFLCGYGTVVYSQGCVFGMVELF